MDLEILSGKIKSPLKIHLSSNYPEFPCSCKDVTIFLLLVCLECCRRRCYNRGGLVLNEGGGDAGIFLSWNGPSTRGFQGADYLGDSKTNDAAFFLSLFDYFPDLGRVHGSKGRNRLSLGHIFRTLVVLRDFVRDCLVASRRPAYFHVVGPP